MLFADGLELLAAIAVMRIGLSLEGSDVVGVDCGGALQSIRGGIMKRQLKLAGLAVLLSVAAHPAVAQEKLKIGIIVTLSGPAAVLGQQVRDGFALQSRISAARWVAATSTSWWSMTNSSRTAP